MNPRLQVARTGAHSVGSTRDDVARTLLDLPEDILYDVMDQVTAVADQNAVRLSHSRLCSAVDACLVQRTQYVAHAALGALAQDTWPNPRLEHMALHAGGIDLRPQVLAAPRLPPLPRQVLLLQATGHVRTAALTLDAQNVVPYRGDWVQQNAVDQQLEALGSALAQNKRLDTLRLSGQGWALPFVQRILRPHMAAQPSIKQLSIQGSAEQVWPLVASMTQLTCLDLSGAYASHLSAEGESWL